MRRIFVCEEETKHKTCLNEAAVCGSDDENHDFWVETLFFESEEEAYNLILDWCKSAIKHYSLLETPSNERVVFQRFYLSTEFIENGLWMRNWQIRENLSIKEIKEIKQSIDNYFGKVWVGLTVGPCVPRTSELRACANWGMLK